MNLSKVCSKPFNDDEFVSDDSRQDEEPFKANTSPIKSLEFSCSFPGCSKKFGKGCRLVLHERTHTGERPFKCSFKDCQKSYTRQFHLTRHIAFCHTEDVCVEEADKYRCEVCDKAYSNKYSFKKHTRVHQEHRYTCPVCMDTFTKQQHLKAHSYQHTGILPHKCEHPGCNKGFKFPNKLSLHMKTHISDRYKCHYIDCAQAFNHYGKLIKHLAEDHPKVCDVCGKEFNQLCRLKSHLLTHQEVREAHFCPYSPCDRYYFDSRNLKHHIMVRHKKMTAFCCKVCDKNFVTKQKLKEHLPLHDPNRTLKQTPKVKERRKPRKDKGSIKRDLPKYLSGFQPKNLPQENAPLLPTDEVPPNEYSVLPKSESFLVPSNEFSLLSLNVDSSLLLKGESRSCHIGGAEGFTPPSDFELSEQSYKPNDETLKSCDIALKDNTLIITSYEQMSKKAMSKESPIQFLDSFNAHNLKLLLKKGSSRIMCKLPTNIKYKS